MEKVTQEFYKKHGNSARVPRLMMINVVMKLMKVLKMVLGKSLHNRRILMSDCCPLEVVDLGRCFDGFGLSVH